MVDFIENSVFDLKLTSDAYKKIKSIMISVLKYAVRKEYINYTFDAVKVHLDITQNDLAETKMTDETEVYTEEETYRLKEFLSNSQMIHDLALLLFFYTGLRNGEMSSLKWEDYDGSVLKIHRMERTEYSLTGERHYTTLDNHAKTKKGMRELPLSYSAIQILERVKALNPDGEYIFEKNGKRITSEALRKRLITVCRKVGIKYKPPHKMRKTFLTILLDGGMSPTLVRDLAGHKDAATTLQYYKFKRVSNETLLGQYEPIIDPLENNTALICDA